MKFENKAIYSTLHKYLEYINQHPDGVAISKIENRYNIKSDNSMFSETHQFMSINLHEVKEFVDYFIEQGQVKEDRSKDEHASTVFKTTIEGKIFLNKGGYADQYELDHQEFKNKSNRLKLESWKNKVIWVIAVLGWVTSILQLIVFYIIKTP